MRSRSGWGTAVFVAAMLCCSTAAAHKLTVFATVEGDAIRGEAAFQNGAPVRRATVKILGPGGELLGQTQTDELGLFRFQPQQRANHRLVLEDGSGHAAEFTVTAEELPEKLAAPPQGPALASAGKPESKVAASAAETAKPASPSPRSPAHQTSPGEDIPEQIAQLRAEIARLRKESAEAHDRLRMRDVLGGVGFLIGLGGTAFYFLGLRKKEHAAIAGDSGSKI